MLGRLTGTAAEELRHVGLSAASKVLAACIEGSTHVLLCSARQTRYGVNGMLGISHPDEANASRSALATAGGIFAWAWRLRTNTA